MPYSFRWIKKVPDVHGIDKNFEIALCMYKEGKKQKGGYKLVIQNVIGHIASQFIRQLLIGFLRGFSAPRIGLILQPVFRNLDEKGSKIQGSNDDPGFGICCSKEAKSQRKSEFMFFFVKSERIVTFISLTKKVAHIFSAKSCAYFDSTAFSYRLPLVPLRWGNLKPITRLFFMIGIIR